VSVIACAHPPALLRPRAAPPWNLPRQKLGGKVAALERHLWKRMEASGYDMLNPQPRATAKPDEGPLG
jgi:hypothetical protein